MSMGFIHDFSVMANSISCCCHQVLRRYMLGAINRAARLGYFWPLSWANKKGGSVPAIKEKFCSGS